MYYRYNFRIIFAFYAAAIILFIACATLLVFYSVGYRYDFDKNLIVQTGLIRLEPIQPNSQIIFNDQLLKPSLIKKTSEITDLKPDFYHVSINHPRYQTWQKSIEVVAKKVHNEYEILMLPTIPVFSEITPNIEGTYNEAGQITALTSTNSLMLYYPNTNLLDQNIDIPINPNTKLKWISYDLILLLTNNPEETNIRGLNTLNNNFTETKIPHSISPDNIIGSLPLQSNKILYQYEQNLYIFDLNLTENPTPEIFRENVSQAIVLGNEIYYYSLSQPNLLVHSDLRLGRDNILTLEENIEQLVPLNNQYLAFVGGKNTYLVNLNSQSIVATIPVQASKVLISPNLEYIVLLTSNELVTIDLTNDLKITTLIRLSENIIDFDFINSHNIAYSTENNLHRIDINGQNNQIIIGATNAIILSADNKKILVNKEQRDQNLLIEVILELTD